MRDTQGAVMVHAEVIVQNPANGVRRSAATDRTGNYSIAMLLPANYDVRITATGFTSSEFHDISVVLAETTTLNAILAVAGTEIEVNVTDNCGHAILDIFATTLTVTGDMVAAALVSRHHVIADNVER